MAELITLNVQAREPGKRIASNQAMGNTYGNDIKENIHFVIDEMTLRKAFRKAGYNHVVNLDIDGKTVEVVFKDVYFRNMSDAIHHVDMYAIKRGEKIEAAVPVNLVGEAPGVRTGNILVQLLNEITVKATPAKMPDNFEVDVSELHEAGDSIQVSQLVNDGDVEIGEAPEMLVAKLDAAKIEEEPETDAETEEVGAADVPSDKGGDAGDDAAE